MFPLLKSYYNSMPHLVFSRLKLLFDSLPRSNRTMIIETPNSNKIRRELISHTFKSPSAYLSHTAFRHLLNILHVIRIKTLVVLYSINFEYHHSLATTKAYHTHIHTHTHAHIRVRTHFIFYILFLFTKNILIS